MVNIRRIDLRLYTANRSKAGTDGEVYLGMAGREFNIDSTGNDFERGSDRIYTLGVGANIKRPDNNDPRKPQLKTEDLAKYPVYLRFEPKGSGPNWNLEWLSATVNPGPSQIKYENPPLRGSPDIWLGDNYGKIVYLTQV